MAVQMHRRHCHSSDQESLDVALRQLSLIEEHLKRFLAAGQPERPRRSSFDLRGVMEELLALLAPTARHRRVQLTTDLPDEPVTLDADRDQLRQGGNEFDTQCTRGRRKRRTSARRNWHPGPAGPPGAVWDNGPGLDPEIAKRLGEAFQTTKPEGVGLGLAVARQVAEGHGGQLLYSRVAEMTCIELMLPAGSEHDSAEQSIVALNESTSLLSPR